MNVLSNTGLSLIRILLGKGIIIPKGLERKCRMRRHPCLSHVRLTKVLSGIKESDIDLFEFGHVTSGGDHVSARRPLIILVTAWLWMSTILYFSFSNQLFSALIYQSKTWVNSLEELRKWPYEGLKVYCIPLSFFAVNDGKSDLEVTSRIRQKILPRMRTKTYGELFGGAPIQDIAEGKAVLVSEDIFLKELINLNPMLSLGVSRETLFSSSIGYFIAKRSPVRKFLFQM